MFGMRAGLLAAGLFLSPAAAADEPQPMHTQLREDWRQIYWQGRNKARKSMIVGGIGAGVMVLGGVSLFKQLSQVEAESATNPGAAVGSGLQALGAAVFLILPGFVVMYIGGGTAAGASVRSHHALKKMGYTRKLPYFSYLSWTSIGGPLVTNPAIGLVTVPMSYGFTGLQLRQDRKAYEAGVLANEPQGGLYLQLAPIVTQDVKGLGLRATF